MDEPSAISGIIHPLVRQPESRLSVSEMCRTAGVSRNGYYAWVRAAPIRGAQGEQDRKDLDIILEAYQWRGYPKGAKGIYMRLLHMDPPVVMNVKKIRRLMDKYDLSCPIREADPYRRITRALKTSSVADNPIQRGSECYGPRTVLLTDITHIPYDGTYAYLSTILDAYTKQILSYVLSGSLEVDSVLETVEELIRDHGIPLTQWTVIHSDQGVHYTSHRFIEITKNKDLRQSMSRKGNCWDNAPQESFFGHMKDHVRDKLKECTGSSQVSSIVDNYMEYYNKEKYQWGLAELSPDESYGSYITGGYPLKIENLPPVPIPERPAGELGRAKALKERGMGTERPRNRLRHSCSYAAAFKKLYKNHGRLNLYVSTILGLQSLCVQ